LSIFCSCGSKLEPGAEIGRRAGARKFVTVSRGTPLYSYGIAYRRGYGSSTSGLFKECLTLRGQQMPSPRPWKMMRVVHLSRHKWPTLTHTWSCDALTGWSSLRSEAAQYSPRTLTLGSRMLASTCSSFYNLFREFYNIFTILLEIVLQYFERILPQITCSRVPV